jgi:hypothetical protein
LPDIFNNVASSSARVKADRNPLMSRHFLYGLFAARLACYKPADERAQPHNQLRWPDYANYGRGLRLIPGRAPKRLSSLSRATRID